MVTHGWPGSVTSLPLRLAVTAAALVALAAGGLVVRALRRRLDEMAAEDVGVRTVTLVLAGGYLALGAGALATMLTVWGLEDELRRFLATDEGRTAMTRSAISVVGLAGAYFLVGVSRHLVDRFVERRPSVSTHQGEVLFRGTQVALYATTLVVLLDVWTVELTNLLVSAGVLGVVLGLAAQQTLGAVIAGFVIMLSRPFEVGDYVRVGDREGTVTDVTLVSTRLRTFDRERVSIPNDVVESGEIVNFSRGGRLRVHLTVSVDYDADHERAAAAAVDALGDLDVALSRPEPGYDAELGDSGVVLDLWFAIDDPSAEKRLRAHRDAVAAVKAALEEADVRIPFPRRELAAREERGGFHVRSEAVGTDGEDAP